MKWKDINLRARIYLVSATILLACLCCAAYIYLTASDETESAVGYEVEDGNAYPTAPENSKIYVRDLELFGGKSAVLANEFRLWFTGLWRGKTLAFSIAVISIVMFLAAIVVAQHSQFDENTDKRRDDNPDRSG